MADTISFVGTWNLISWEVTQPDGTIHYLYGKDVVGYLINTHSHFDHVYTNHLFPEATVISTHRGA
jgi:hypothetical protein